MNEQVLIARREKNFDISGVGCLIQVLGLIAPFVIGVFLGFIGGAVGTVVLAVALFVGSAKHTKWICGYCNDPIDSVKVVVCPTCGAHFE